MSKTEMIKFKLSNCPLFAKKLNVNEKLNEIRAKFQKELPKDSLFFCSDGTQIKSEDEKDFILKDVIEKEENAYVLQLKNKENEESIQISNDLTISGVDTKIKTQMEILMKIAEKMIWKMTKVELRLL